MIKSSADIDQLIILNTLAAILHNIISSDIHLWTNCCKAEEHYRNYTMLRQTIFRHVQEWFFSLAEENLEKLQELRKRIFSTRKDFSLQPQ